MMLMGIIWLLVCLMTRIRSRWCVLGYFLFSLVGLKYVLFGLQFGSSVPDSEPSRADNSLIHKQRPHESEHGTPRAIVDARDTGYEGNALSSSLISFGHEAAANSSSILHGLQALTQSPNRPIPSLIPPVSALSQLKDYSSHVEGSVNEPSASTSYLRPLRPRLPSSSPRSQTFPPPSLKRPYEAIGKRHLLHAPNYSLYYDSR